jgi:hypothetical protein
VPETLPDVHTGDQAEGFNVQNLTDLVKGLFGFPVSLTRHSGAEPTLKLRNRQAGAPILEMYAPDGVTLVYQFLTTGLASQTIVGYQDFTYYGGSSSPAAPGPGTGKLRMYARGGQLFFKAEGSAEQQIPIGLPPGPSLRYGFWSGTIG